jgi:hypothetical protein
MTWHVDDAAARRYSAGTLDDIGCASVEAHLERCDRCRALVAGAATDVDLALLASVWADIDDELDGPRPGWIESMLHRIGVDEATARIVAATRRARWGYLVAVAASVALAVLAWHADDEPGLLVIFMIVAPIGPLIATAGSFSWADPVIGIIRATPYSALRILLLRTAAAVVPAVALTLLAVPWLLDDGWVAIGWLLPSLALVSCALALSSWIPLERAVVALLVVWVIGVVIAQQRIDAADVRTVADVADFTESAGTVLQVVSLVAIAVAAAIIVVRRTAYEYREV